MTDLNKDKRKYPSHNYVAYNALYPGKNKTFSARQEACNYASKRRSDYIVSTFKEAAISHPEEFVYSIDGRGNPSICSRNGGAPRKEENARSLTISLRVSKETRSRIDELKKNGLTLGDMVEEYIAIKAKELGIEE